MQFLALTALALTLIGRCLAEPIPVDAMRRDDLEARAPPPPIHLVNGRPPPNLKEFWPCMRCSIECAAVVFGCGVVCTAAEIDGPLCGLCIAGAGGSKACVECWPRCRGQPGMDFIIRHHLARPVNFKPIGTI